MSRPPSQSDIDKKWMRVALGLAQKAAGLGEVPVGAVLVGPEGLLSQGANRRETLHTPLGHAELMALHKAAKSVKNWRLEDTTLYVTLEPCLMCAGAILQARVGRVVFGTMDPKAGAVYSLYQTFQDPRLNHQVEFTSGVLANECAELLQDFFKARRETHKKEKLEKHYRYRSSVVVVHEGKILGFHAEDPTSLVKYFFLPGGQIESGESARDCAVRETLEETGYKIALVPELELRRRYDFEWNGRLHHCDTVFFVGLLDEPWRKPGVVNDTAYHKGVDWVETRHLRDVFNYDPDILWGVQWGVKQAKKLLSHFKPVT
jgi:tRNA(adenine34) deaminase